MRENELDIDAEADPSFLIFETCYLLSRPFLTSAGPWARAGCGGPSLGSFREINELLGTVTTLGPSDHYHSCLILMNH